MLSAINGKINPCSSEFKKSTQDFKTLSKKHKVLTVSLTVLTGYFTLFLLGIGGYATFQALVKRFKPEQGGKLTEKTSKTSKVSQKILESEIKKNSVNEDKAALERKTFLANLKNNVVNLTELADQGVERESTGSGKMKLYKEKNGNEYLLKKNRTVEFYAGTLFKLILGERAPNILFVKSGKDFYAGSRWYSTFEDIWSYNFDHKKIPNEDMEGLAEIVVASYLLGEIDLKGLKAAESSIGIVQQNNRLHYFKIDHEQAFVFGGADWQKDYILDDKWKEKLQTYYLNLGLECVAPYVDKAIQKIASIPLKDFEKACDFCEETCNSFSKQDEILQNLTFKKELFYGMEGNPTIKEAVMQRIQKFQDLATKA